MNFLMTPLPLTFFPWISRVVLIKEITLTKLKQGHIIEGQV